ncbi:hypothetical protein [Euhalothece natronophila]|nr:hypothetical protein [Euhalothece natronophila]
MKTKTKHSSHLLLNQEPYSKFAFSPTTAIVQLGRIAVALTGEAD